MTSQTKHYIELSDILALRFECKNCKTSVTFGMSQNFDLKKLSDCPGCKKTWVYDGYDISIQAEIEEVINSIKRLSGILGPEGKFQTELRLFLEIAQSPESATRN
ncbi:MAG: hypothetical protein ABSG11_10785 [Candidatus Korobacteraceae bacterium]